MNTEIGAPDNAAFSPSRRQLLATTGALFAFITAFMLAYEPIKRLAKSSTVLQRGLSAADRLFRFADTK